MSILYVLEYFSKWSPVFEVTYFQFIVYVHTSRMYIYVFP